MTTDELLDLTWIAEDGSLSPIMESEVWKIHVLINYKRHMLENGKASNFVEFRNISITRKKWIRFVKIQIHRDWSIIMTNIFMQKLNAKSLNISHLRKLILLKLLINNLHIYQMTLSL